MFIVEDNFLWHLIGPSDQLAAMKICPKMQKRSYNAPNLSMAIVFPWFLSLCFDISINIHEYANEMSFILTIGINIFVIYGITGAISCHNDSVCFTA